MVVYSSSQSLGEKWAGWLASRGRNERGSRVAAARARPAQSPTQRPQKLPRRLDIARAPIHQVGKAELSPNNIIAAAREQLAREPSHLPDASSPSSRRSLKISPIQSFPNLPSIRHCTRAADCCNCSGPESKHPVNPHTIAKMVGKKSGRALLREEGK